MKKFLIVLLLAMGIATTAEAQVMKYRATDVAFRYEISSGNWSNWSDWEKSSVLVVLNLNNATVQIYSQETQEFDIVGSVSDWTSDSKGGQQFEVSCVDKDGKRCHMRFRKQGDGQLQLYVDYSDFMYVYNIEPRQ
jgi:hypothetical protein